jgi:hypothetical protein
MARAVASSAGARHAQFVILNRLAHAVSRDLTHDPRGTRAELIGPFSYSSSLPVARRNKSHFVSFGEPIK